MNVLKKLRRERFLTQAQLAEKVGTTQPQIMRLEKSQRTLTKDWAEKLAPHLGVRAEMLLFGGDLANETEEEYARRVLKGKQSFIHKDKLQNEMFVFFCTSIGENFLKIKWLTPVKTVPKPWFVQDAGWCFGIILPNNEMSPVYHAGDTIILSASIDPEPGQDALFVDGDISTERQSAIRTFIREDADDWIVRIPGRSDDTAWPKNVWKRPLCVLSRSIET